MSGNSANNSSNDLLLRPTRNFDGNIYVALKQYTSRCLVKSQKWAADLLSNYNDKLRESNTCPPPASSEQSDVNELANLTLSEFAEVSQAQALFHQQQYKYASSVLSDRLCRKNQVARFLKFYSLYKEMEKNRWEHYLKNDGVILFDTFKQPNLVSELNKQIVSFCKFEDGNFKEIDSYTLYLLAVIQKHTSTETCLNLLIKAVKLNYLNWPAWMEISNLLTSVEQLNFVLNSHHAYLIESDIEDGVELAAWIKAMFVVECHIKLNIKNTSYLHQLVKFLAPVANSCFYKSQMARLYHMAGENEQARIVFHQLRQKNPYTLENIDIYSNILFTKNDIVGLTNLVKELVIFAKFQPETCFAAGNLYNLAGMHEKALDYFKQTVRLDPSWAHAWTLLGHEYIELKDLASATTAYRKALDMNKREYRAWYGLGLIYELMKRPEESVAMFERALSVRPGDARVLYAIACVCIKLRIEHKAILCLRRCAEDPDTEYMASYELARLLSKRNKDEAAVNYERFLKSHEQVKTAKANEECEAVEFLMNYNFMQRKDVDKAELYARKLKLSGKDLMGASALKQATTILRQIHIIRKRNKLLEPSRGSIIENVGGAALVKGGGGDDKMELGGGEPSGSEGDVDMEISDC